MNWTKAQAAKDAQDAADTACWGVMKGREVVSVHKDGSAGNLAYCAALDAHFEASTQEHPYSLVRLRIPAEPGQVVQWADILD